MKSDIIWKSLTILFCIGVVGTAGYITYQERQPEFKYQVLDTGIVTASGCVNSYYKTTLLFDCSVKIDMVEEGPIKRVMKIGVLPGDTIKKYCGIYFNDREYKCSYGR